jgi:hypothetical protein
LIIHFKEHQRKGDIATKTSETDAFVEMLELAILKLTKMNEAI